MLRAMSLFLRAANGEDTSRAPIWLMRQAGRYLPEYRALKERYTFWELCRTPELGVEVTMQPLRRFPLDAAILFSDIMTPLSSMGVQIDFAPGPVIETPIRTRAQVDQLRVPEAEEIAPFVGAILRALRQECPVPVIGFGGAPLTLATYLVQGGGSKDYALFRQFLRSEPEAAHALLGKIADVSLRYLQMQIEAGAQTIQLFDSWAGLHGVDMYEEFGAPYARRVLEGLKGVPRVYIAIASGHLLPSIAKLPVEMVSVDWRTPLHVARPIFEGKALQGNLDPALLLAPHDVLGREANRVLREGLGGAHVFNLGHGMMKEASPDAVAHLVETVHAFDRHADR
jgi:uroporphyrinogen decarboxylase